MRVEPIQWEAQQSGPPGKLHQKSTTIPKWRAPKYTRDTAEQYHRWAKE